MEQQALEVIFKQLPIIIFLSLVIWVGYKYFTKELEKREAFFIKELEKRELFFQAELDRRDVLIGSKDEEIKSLNQKLVALTSQCLDQGNRNNELISGLKNMVEKFIPSIK